MAKITIKGEVTNVLEAKRGNGAKGEWITQTFVIKETEEKYPKTIAFDIFGEEKIKDADIKIGDIISIEANIESREWNGRYFTSVKAREVTKVGGVQKSEPVTATQEVNNMESEKSDLPFQYINIMSINKVILIGNVGKEPEVKTTESGKKVAKITIATTEKFKTASGEVKENTEWHNIVFWGTLSDVIEKYVKKGSMLYIEGKITSRSYESGGEKKYITEIVGNSIQLLDKKS